MNQTPPPKSANTMMVQFFLRHGAVVVWPVPSDQPFNLAVLAINIRSNGYFMSDDCYIPADEIACIGLAGGAARIRQPSVQQAPHPTKQ